ncbi:MAG: hypothetical protein ACXAE3_07060, partial [Candidatus Kariarchaeaceae archaeon]
ESKSILGKLGDLAKDTAKQGMQKVGEKAVETAKAGAQVVGDKVEVLADKGKKMVEEKVQEVMESAIPAEILDAKERAKYDKPADKRQPKRGRLAQFEDDMNRTGRSLENQAVVWYGWFWSTIAYMFIIMISFAITSADPRFRLLPIILLVGFPFFLYTAVVSSIPEIRIGNRVLFSRHDLSLRNQLTFTARVARAFSREMIEASPVGAFLIYSFLILLVIVLVGPFIEPF